VILEAEYAKSLPLSGRLRLLTKSLPFGGDFAIRRYATNK